MLLDTEFNKIKFSKNNTLIYYLLNFYSRMNLYLELNLLYSNVDSTIIKLFYLI